MVVFPFFRRQSQFPISKVHLFLKKDPGTRSEPKRRSSRVAMGVDVLARLHQQIQQVLISMWDARQPKPKT